MTWREAISAARRANNENWIYINAKTFVECDIPIDEPFEFTMWTANHIYFADALSDGVQSIKRNPPKGNS